MCSMCQEPIKSLQIIPGADIRHSNTPATGEVTTQTRTQTAVECLDSTPLHQFSGIKSWQRKPPALTRADQETDIKIVREGKGRGENVCSFPLRFFSPRISSAKFRHLICVP